MPIVNTEMPEWCEALGDPNVRYFGIRGGRGSGKSQNVAKFIVIEGAKRPIRVLCVREVQRSIRDSVKRVLADEIERCGLSDRYDILDTEIRGKNGSLIIFMGLYQNSTNIKSTEGIDVCWGEESEAFSGQSLDVLLPTIRKPGSKLYFTWNPRHETDAIEQFFDRGNLPPKSLIIDVNYTDNPWFPDDLRQLMEYDRARDIDKYNHVWLGQFESRSDARVFNNWTVQEFTPPADVIFKQGADWGFAVDPTVLVRCYIEGKQLYVVDEAYQHQCQIHNLPLLFNQIPDASKYPIVADGSRPETISYMKLNGFPHIYAATKGAGSVIEGIEWLKTFDIIVHPKCKQTINELTHYKYKVDKDSNMVTSVLKDENNHVIDALRYACEAARKNDRQVKPRPVVAPVPTIQHWSR